MSPSQLKLTTLFNSVNTTYFEGKATLPIRWGRRSLRFPSRSIRLGSYNLKTSEIRIHPLLDHPEIPNYVVEYIIYHEILHHFFPPVKNGRKRKIHHAYFKQQEKAFPKYTEAKLFIKEFLKHHFSRN